LIGYAVAVLGQRDSLHNGRRFLWRPHRKPKMTVHSPNRTSHPARTIAIKPILLSVGLLASVTGQAEDGGGDLRSAVQNPISSLISLPFKFQFDYGADNGEASFLNI
jgi:hypothetical protein